MAACGAIYVTVQTFGPPINDVDSAACQIHSASCSYKVNSKYLEIEFKFFINRSSNFRIFVYNIPTHTSLKTTKE